MKDSSSTTPPSRCTGPPETIYDACRRGNTTRFMAYVEKGGCLTECDDQNMTLLHHAAFSGNIKFVQVILSRGNSQLFSIDAADKEGWTPLHYGADRGHADVISALLEEGANVNARDSLKRTPLHLAALSARMMAARVLLQHGASKTARNVAGLTPADCAEAAGHAEVVRLLTE